VTIIGGPSKMLHGNSATLNKVGEKSSRQLTRRQNFKKIYQDAMEKEVRKSSH